MGNLAVERGDQTDESVLSYQRENFLIVHRSRDQYRIPHKMVGKIENMKSGLIFFALVFAAVAAAPDKQEAKAQLLDQNQYLCSNCFFGASTYYFCFEAGDKILIGYQKIPTINWKDSASNDLTKVHKSWQPWVTEGKDVPLRYDDKHIWVTGPTGKTVKLTQDYTTDIFINNSQCRGAIKKKPE